MAKPPVTPPPAASALGRFFTLAGSATRIAGGLLGQSLVSGRSAIDWQPVGEQLGAVLGEMKGPVLKLGQMASQWQGVLPAPATLLVNRTLEGHYWNLSRLGVALPLADLLHERMARDSRG